MRPPEKRCLRRQSVFQKRESKLKHLGEAHIAQDHRIKQWQTVIATILGFISDTLHPQGFDAIAKDNFTAMREMLPPGLNTPGVVIRWSAESQFHLCVSNAAFAERT